VPQEGHITNKQKEEFMILILIINLIFSNGAVNQSEISKSIRKLRKCTPEKTIKIFEKVLTTRSERWGITKKEFPLILAMAKYETNFIKSYKGKAGEIGMLQVIPYEMHIKKIVAKIECLETDKYCINGLPAIYFKGKLSGYRTRRFLIEHPKYALETGFGEIQYWKNRYKKRLHRKWRKKRSTYWVFLKKRMGDLLFVNHYNWGNRICTSKPARYYGLNVLKYYNKILDRKKYEIYR
jgi:hypothetical protein